MKRIKLSISVAHHNPQQIFFSVSAGIGDGGNELGMGKVKEKVKALMPKGDLIACDVPADYAITAGTALQSIGCTK